MTKNISEKDFRQAVFTKLNPNQQKCLNHIVKQFTLFDQVFISQQAIADAIGLTRETVCKYIKHFCELNLLKKFRRFGKNFKKSNLYTLNSFFKEIKERLVQILPALKGWLGTPIYSVLKENVTIRRIMPTLTSEETSKHGDPSSSSPHFCKKKVETVSLAEGSLENNLLFSVNHIVSHLETIKSCRLSYKTPKNNLKKEEYEKQFAEFSANSNDSSITEMYRHIQFDYLGSEESFYTN